MLYNNKVLVLYQTIPDQIYTKDLVTELYNLKIPNVIIEPSRLKKELDGRYSETNRFLMISNYMNKRRARYMIDVRGTSHSEKPSDYINWSPELASVYCNYKRVKTLKQHFANYSKLIEIEPDFNNYPNPNHYTVGLSSYRSKSEQFEFLKDFVSFFQSRL